MARKIRIEGDIGDQRVFLDGDQIFPTSVYIKLSCKESVAILTYEQIEIEVDTETEVRERTEHKMYSTGKH